MANVIDRLRVQGNPAPRNLPSQPESGLSRLGGRSGGERELPPDGRTMQFVLKHSHLQNRETNSGRRMNQAARRLEHLQRVQQANQGLSTMDVRQPDLPGKQFMLRGKPASADTILHRHHYLQQQQDANSSAASAKSAQARTSKPHQDGAFNGVLAPVRSELRDSVVNGNDSSAASLGPTHPTSASHLSTATSYFMLANPTTLNTPLTRSANAGYPGSKTKGEQRLTNSGTMSGTAGPRQLQQQHSAGSAASFELTGRQVITPRSITGYEDTVSTRDYVRSPHNRAGYRDIRPSVLRERRSPGLKDATAEQPTVVDPQSLRQCLHVQQSSNPDSSADAALKLKHYTQYTRAAEPKVNYNNPYRQTRPKERRPLPESERRYIFDSVASYIHFNKIYPQMKEPSNNKPSKTPPRSGFQGLAIHKDGLPKIPHLAGFPKHCTDTILLRMMFEMNRPGAVHGIGLGHQAAGAPSVRSSISNKYSDIGRYRDLDEFFVQGETPITSQRQQLSSHRSTGTLSFHGLPTAQVKEKDEERRKGGGEGAREETDRIAEEEDESTLRTATTPGRRMPGDDDDEDADDEASQWNARTAPAKAGGRKRVGGKGAGGRGASGMESVNGVGETEYDTDTTLDTTRQ